MNFILGQLKQLSTVATVMVCATGGTVGLLKLIGRFAPGAGFPKDPASRGPEGNGEERES